MNEGQPICLFLFADALLTLAILLKGMTESVFDAT